MKKEKFDNGKPSTKKYAIVIKETGEFYANPTYTNLNSIINKIKYLTDYQKNNSMSPVEYGIEELTPERLAAHNQEWSRFVALLD